jgi:hypothetical protein
VRCRRFASDAENPPGFAGFAPRRAGRYELRLALSTDGPTEEEWLGFIGYPGEEDVRARSRDVPRVRVTSNLLVVDVIGEPSSSRGGGRDLVGQHRELRERCSAE